MANHGRARRRKPRASKKGSPTAEPAAISASQPAQPAATRPPSPSRHVYSAQSLTQPIVERSAQPTVPAASTASQTINQVIHDIHGIGKFTPRKIRRLATIPSLGRPSYTGRAPSRSTRAMTNRRMAESLEDRCIALAASSGTLDHLDTLDPIAMETEVDAIQYLRWAQAVGNGGATDTTDTPAPSDNMWEVQRVDKIRTGIWRELGEIFWEAGPGSNNVDEEDGYDDKDNPTHSWTAANVPINAMQPTPAHMMPSTTTTATANANTPSTFLSQPTGTANTTANYSTHILPSTLAASTPSTYRARDTYLATLYDDSSQDFDTVMRNMAVNLERAKLLNAAAQRVVHVQERNETVREVIGEMRIARGMDPDGGGEYGEKEGDDDVDVDEGEGEDRGGDGDADSGYGQA